LYDSSRGRTTRFEIAAPYGEAKRAAVAEAKRLGCDRVTV
jgi:hypothetical protein